MAITGLGSSVRPWIRRLAIAACVVLGPLSCWTLWDYVEARRLAAVVAEVKASGEPIAPPQRSPDGVDAPDNAARYYDAAGALVDTSGLEGATGLQNRLDRGYEPTADLAGDLRAFLDRNHEAEGLLATATTLEFRGVRPGFEYNYRVDRLIRLAALADLRTLERTQGGDGDGAVVALIQQLRITRPLGWSASSAFNDVVAGFASYAGTRAASEVSQVIPLAPSKAALERLQSALAVLDVDASVEQQLLAQRARLLGAYWDDGHRWYARPPRTFETPSGPMFYLLRPWIVHRAIAEARILGDLLVTARRPWPDRLRVDLPGEQAIAAARRSGFFLAWGVMGPEASRYLHSERTQATASTLAVVRSAMTVVAIARYRQTHERALPTVLSDLVPSLLPSVPIDPYSGHPLRYLHDAARYAVYSIGRNEKDEGGKDLNQQLSRSWGAYSKARRPADLGVEVREAGARR